MNFRQLFLWLIALLALATINVLVYQSEQLAANGQAVFLELAPVDPRSLLQGDYMRLRYALSDSIEANAVTRDGFIVVRLDENGVAQYARIHNPQTPLAESEVLLRSRQRDFDVYIGPESFFFQEGHAQYYTNARYAELRVSAAGDVLLTGLRGPKLELLGPP